MKAQTSSVIQADKGWRIWWQLARPHTLTAAFVPVFLGTALAAKDHAVHIPLFLAMMIASLLIQAATNMFNEYFDFARGLDHEESVGIGGAIVRNGVKPKNRFKFSFYPFWYCTPVRCLYFLKHEFMDCCNRLCVYACRIFLYRRSTSNCLQSFW